MRESRKILVVAAIMVLVVFAALAVLTPSDVVAGGKGGGKGNKPPKCDNCAPEITLPNGDVCTLEACGSDCVYSCPFPG